MSEFDLQKFAVTLLRFNAIPGVIFFHVPNGEYRSPRTGARLKAMGVMPGVADLVVIKPNGLVYFLELKTAKGTLSKPQRAFRDACDRIGLTYEVASSPEAAEGVSPAGIVAAFEDSKKPREYAAGERMSGGKWSRIRSDRLLPEWRR